MYDYKHVVVCLGYLPKGYRLIIDKGDMRA